MRIQFYKKYKQHAQEYEPRFVHPPGNSTLFAKANLRLAIKEAARRKVKLRILYKKLQNPKDSVEYYEISPMSMRYRHLSIGIRKMLYAWDDEKLPHQVQRAKINPKKYKGRRKRVGSVKSFTMANILNCDVTDTPYSKEALKYPISIK